MLLQVALAVPAVVALLVGGVVGWRRLLQYTVVRRWLSARAVHFELVPRGERNIELVTAGKSMAEVIGTLRDQRRFPRPRLSVHRWVSGGVVHLGVTIAGARSKHAAQQIARAIGRVAGAEIIELPGSPLPVCPTLVYGTRVAFNAVTNIAGVLRDSHAIDRLATEAGQRLMDIGGAAFLTVSVVPVADRERNALTAWVAGRLQQITSLSGSAQHPWLAEKILTRGMVVAGGPDIESAKTLVGLARLLPDYDSQLRAHPSSDMDPTGYYAAAGVLVGAGIAASGVVAHRLAPVPFGVAIGGSSAVVLVAAASGVLRVARRTMARWLAAGLAPVPARPLISWRHGLHGGAQRAGFEEGARPEWHPYRMVRRLLVMAPSHLAAAAMFPPPTAAAATATGASQRSAPSAVRDALGARLGYDPDGFGCQVPDGSRSGIACAGDPGQGKSTLLLSVWASDLIGRSAECASMGELRRALLWLETKGEGAARALRAARACGYDERSLVLLDVTAPTGPQLSLVDHSRPQRSAELLAEAMRYAFPDREIMAESEDTLRAVFALAIAIPGDVLAAAGEPGNQGFMTVAHKLAYGDTSTAAHKRITEAVDRYLRAAPRSDMANPLAGGASHGDGLGDSTLADCYRQYATKLRTREADNEAMFSAPRNKIGKLLPAAGLWQPDPERCQITLQELLAQRMAAVVNFGGAAGFADELRSRLGAITVYCLWHAIKTACDDWAQRGQSITVFSDEVADIAGTGNPGVPDIVRLMHDHGRSRGVRLALATQRLAQLPEATVRAVLSFPTKIYLRQEDVQVAESAIADLGDDCGFAASDIRRLQPMIGIVRMRVGDLVQPPFTLAIALENELTPAQFASPTRKRAADVDAA